MTGHQTVKCLAVFILASAPAAAGGEIFTGDLAGWWRFDDASDSSAGGTRPLTLLGGATTVNLNGDGALRLEPDPSDNRAVTGAFNPTSSFSVVVDFQADAIPSGGVSPQFNLLSNIGDDSLRFGDQFLLSPGYQVVIRPGMVSAFQKNAGGTTDNRTTSLNLPNPTGRHTIIVNWVFESGQFTPTVYLDGSSTTATGTAGPMDFSGGATKSLILGTNIDEAFFTPRTMDGLIYEAAVFNGMLSVVQVNAVAEGGVAAIVPEPAGLGAAATLWLMWRRKRLGSAGCAGSLRLPR